MQPPVDWRNSTRTHATWQQPSLLFSRWRGPLLRDDVLTNAVGGRQLVAIPNPFRFWMSVGRYNLPRVFNVDDARYADMLASGIFEIPSPENYYALCLHPTVLQTHATTTARSLTLRPDLRTFAVVLEIETENDDTLIPVNVSVDGTGGYAFAADVVVSEARARVFCDVPLPWGDRRDITITWTGGKTICRAFSYIYQYTRLLPKTLPEGWTPNPQPQPLCHDYQDDWYVRSPRSVRESEHVLPSVIVKTTAEEWVYNEETEEYALEDVDYFRPERTLPLPRIGNTSSWGIAGSSFTPCMTAAVAVNTITNVSRFVPPGDPLAPFAGMAFIGADGTWLRHLSSTDGPNIVQAGVVFNPFASILSIHAFVFEPTDYDYEVTYEWDILSAPGYIADGVAATSFASATIAYEDPGAYIQPITLPAAPFRLNAIGSKPGYIANSVEDGGSGSALTGLLIVEEPMPLPFSIPCSNGDIVPGGYDPDMVEPCASMQVADIDSDTITYADAVPGPGGWVYRFVNRPAGVYRLDTFLGLHGVDEVSHARYRDTRGISDAFGITAAVTDGTLPLYVGELAGFTNWNNVQGSEVQPDPSPASVSLVRVEAAPNSLAIGENWINQTQAQAGYATAPWSSLRVPFFQQFTAGAAGLYTFSLISSQFTWQTAYRFAIYTSKTSPYCATGAPVAHDYYDGESISLTGIVDAPPTIAEFSQARVLVAPGATGAFAGHEGEIAYARRQGASDTAPREWAFQRPWRGLVAYSGSDRRLYTGSAWVSRADILTWTVPLNASETVYFRVATLLGPTVCHTNGGGFPYGSSISSSTGNKLRIDVSGPA